MSNTTDHRQTTVHLRATVKKSTQSKVVRRCIALISVLALTACTETTPQQRNLSALIAHYAEQTYPNYKHVMIDLNNDGVEDALVLLQGRSWCGSDGCPLLVLQGEGASYRIVSKSSVMPESIRVAESSSNGWRDLIVHSEGVEKLLQFAERAYPANPSTQATATQEQLDSAKIVLQ